MTLELYVPPIPRTRDPGRPYKVESGPGAGGIRRLGLPRGDEHRYLMT
jgi:hypothetical protein